MTDLDITNVIVSRIINEIITVAGERHGTVKIASVPEIIIKINKMLEDDSITIFEIAELVQSDTALTAHVLKVANSPLLCRMPSTSIKDAIHRLGVGMVKNLAVVTLLRNQVRARHPILADMVRTVAHETARVTTAMFIITKSFTELKPDVAVLMGLVHNIGKMVAISYINDSCTDAEIEAINLDRVLTEINKQVGRAVLARWGIPPIITDVVCAKRAAVSSSSSVHTYKHVFAFAKKYVEGDEGVTNQLQPHLDAHKRDIEDFMRMFAQPPVVA